MFAASHSPKLESRQSKGGDIDQIPINTFLNGNKNHDVSLDRQAVLIS